MPQSLQLLGASLGLGVLSGLSLYLTVAVVGFSLHMHWLVLSPGMEPIQVLDNPWIWGTALALYVIEFFADKVPWVDSAWDSVHTVIRPVGAMFVATKALGGVQPPVEILGVLLAGGAAFATHATKASTRLVANHSPEPFSNIALSVVEDAAVVVGVPLVMKYPVWSGAIALLGLVVFAWFAPILFRALRTSFHFMVGKLNFGRRPVNDLPNYLPHQADLAVARAIVPGEKIEWAVPCVTGKFPGIGRNVHGYLVSTSAQSHLYFVGRRTFKSVLAPIPLNGTRVDYAARFMANHLVLYSATHGVLGMLRFTKSREPLADLCAERVRVMTGSPLPEVKAAGLPKLA
jgi:hypothetical protein